MIGKFNCIGKDPNGYIYRVIYTKPTDPSFQVFEGNVIMMTKELCSTLVTAKSEEDAICVFKDLLKEELPIDELEFLGVIHF